MTKDSHDPARSFSVDSLEKYLASTGDLQPIHYLIDKYLRDQKVAQQEALAKLAAFADHLPALMAAAGLTKPARR